MASDIRLNHYSGQHVIIENNGSSKEEFFTSDPPATKKTDVCPFCEGFERKTPPEIVAWRSRLTKPNTPGWTVRTVSNRYPALQIEGGLNRQGVGMHDQMAGIGADEIIITTPSHQTAFYRLSEDELKGVLWMMRDRILDLKKDRRFRFVLVFDHELSYQDHSHLHVYAFPLIIPRIRQELTCAEDYYQIKERCLYCDTISEELRIGERLIAQGKNFISLQPFPARQTFETWILPIIHTSDFEDLRDFQLDELAKIISDFWKRLTKIIGEDISYQFTLHTAPNQDTLLKASNPWPNLSLSYHWHLEIRPWTKMEKTSFERSTGVYQNPVPPEISAKWLREAL